MKHKVADLEGALLDAAVAKAEGKPYVRTLMPSSVWEDGGPIVDRERIATRPETKEKHGNDGWRATTRDNFTRIGPTPLIAAMRAYVASKLGEEVELP